MRTPFPPRSSQPFDPSWETRCSVPITDCDEPASYSRLGERPRDQPVHLIVFAERCWNSSFVTDEPQFVCTRSCAPLAARLFRLSPSGEQRSHRNSKADREPTLTIHHIALNCLALRLVED